MLQSSQKHLNTSKCTYFKHFSFAIYAAVLLFIAGFTSLIHAIVPAFFPATAASIVIHLYNHRLKNHPNPVYKKMLEK